MNKNMGKIDKTIRLILALIIAALYFGNIINGAIGITLVALAIIFAVTSFINFCPLYTLFGINTCSIKGKK